MKDVCEAEAAGGRMRRGRTRDTESKTRTPHKDVGNKHVTPDNFEDVEEPDLMYDDPNFPLRRREDQGRAHPEFKGTVESLSRENKHIILERR